MGTPNGTGASRRLRIAGLALVGLAVIAALIGLVVATTRDERTSATAPPAATPTPDSRPAIPSTIPYPPTVTSSPAAAPIAPPLGPPDAAQGAPVGGEGPSDQGHGRGEVRVYNNSTIRGLAARAAEDLSAAGWTVIEVGNYAQGTIPTTTAYYQEDTGQRDDAEAIGSEFGMRVEPRFVGIANARPGLIVIVTNDYVSP
ncbi:MAG: LytR C-terminal domain-containing protein [Pseudonocardiaceae bacterium]